VGIGEGSRIELSAGRAGLGAWGELRVSGRYQAWIDLRSGDTLQLSAELAADITNFVLWLNIADGQLLLVPTTEISILLVDLDKANMMVVDSLSRYDEPDLRHVKIRPAPMGALVILYECGLICLDASGTLRWHVFHDDISADIVTVESDRIILVAQWPPEIAGRRRSYAISNGQELPS
jgi:hypothetical protein